MSFPIINLAFWKILGKTFNFVLLHKLIIFLFCLEMLIHSFISSGPPIRIIFKLKGYKTGFSTKKFSSLEEIVNLQTYENLDLINYTFTRAKKARKEKLYEQDSIISTKPNPNKFFIDLIIKGMEKFSIFI